MYTPRLRKVSSSLAAGVQLEGGRTHQMGVLQLFNNLNIIELDVEKLVYGFQYASDRDVILEFHCDFVVDKSFEEARDDY